MKERKNNNKLILFSKVVLMRNIKDFLFTTMLDFESSNILVDEVVKIFEKYSSYKVVDLDEDKKEYVSMLISKKIVDEAYLNVLLKRKIIIRKDLKVCIVLNNENHIEIISMYEGNNIKKAYEACKEVSDFIEENFKIAFSDKYGYLTTNISTLGTGMKAMHMIHIPLLDISGQISSLRNIVSKIGYTIDETYKINNNSNGGLFTLSTTNTFNITEEETIANLNNITKQITEREQILRNEMIKKERERMEDEVLRAYGILTNAKLVSEKESFVLLSYLKLGTDLSLLENKNLENKDPLKILYEVIDGNLKYKLKKKMTTLELDIKRANIIKEKLLI